MYDSKQFHACIVMKINSKIKIHALCNHTNSNIILFHLTIESLNEQFPTASLRLYDLK